MTRSRVEQWERRTDVPLLLLVGISLVGVVTASVAAWLIANVERRPDVG